MNYVFFGTPEFAAVILEKLIGFGFLPKLVITNPDKPTGRKKINTPPPVKVVAEKHGIPIAQPASLKELSDMREELKRLGCDVFVVAAYGRIIPRSVLEIPRFGTVNVHPSLLPRYRGPTPIQSAILNGDEISGVSIMLLDEEVDHGSLIAQREVTMTNDDDDDDYEALSRKLAELGAEMLIEILPKYIEGAVKPTPQDHSKATFTKKFPLDDAFVKYDELMEALNGNVLKAKKIDRMIRALNPEPGVWTIVGEPTVLGLPKNKRVKLLEAGMGGGKLILKKIQVESKTERRILK